MPIASFDRVPVLIAHPAADTWTVPALSRATADRPPGDARWVDLDGATHLPIEQPGYAQLQRAVLQFLNEAAAR